MKKAMTLKQCDICGDKVILTVFAGIDKYMCSTCKAVYFDNGKRDPKYPSIYDQPQGEAAFAAMHKRLVNTTPQPRRTGLAWGQWTPQQRVALSGHKYDELVQWRRNTYADWQFGIMKDYDSEQRLWAVETGNGNCLWLDGSQFRNSMQPLPPPVVAPPSQAAQARTTKKSVNYSGAVATVTFGYSDLSVVLKRMAALSKKAPGKAAHGCWAWTYQRAGGKTIAIKADITKVSKEVVDLGMRVMAWLIPNVFRHRWHLVDFSSGALLGTGTNKRNLVRTMRNELSACDQGHINRTLTDAAKVLANAVEVGYQSFFDRDFQDKV